MFTVDWSLVTAIAMPVISLFIGAGLNSFFEKRAKLITYIGHVSGIQLSTPTGPLIINTHSIVLRNNGRKTANDIHLGHYILPDFQIQPDIEYQVNTLPGGQKEIVIPKLVPKKEITITYLYFPPNTWNQINTHLESDEGPIKVIRVLPTVQPPRWLVRILWFLIAYGLVALLYTLLVIFLTAASHKT
ncbi:hypothetical protein Lnau_2128 [Legionella nautarum]|uniref:Uncharacterized protein n=1 Tax=Legionella nautarum TaxID=45070 RepID=A0A0W0WND6_9GAMM|nr:hypothetical protein [Legionella nautarum]KTD33836.1 hypothetical protein Lnau_2128 [Legionella nautarum]